MGRVGELLVILTIVFLLFGTRRLSSFGSDLGAAIKGFKNQIGDDKQMTHEPKAVVTEALNTEQQKI